MSKFKVKVLWKEIKSLTQRNERLERDRDSYVDEIQRLGNRCTGYSNVLLATFNKLERLRNECEKDWNSEQFKGSFDTKDMYTTLDLLLTEAKDNAGKITNSTSR